MGFLKKKAEDVFLNAGNEMSIIGPEAYFQGTLTAKGSLRVDGRMEGSVVDAQTVVIGQTGRITGDISAQSVVVGGEVRGNITASQYAELLAKSRTKGDIASPRLLIEDGAFFEGRCSMLEERPEASNTPAAEKIKTR